MSRAVAVAAAMLVGCPVVAPAPASAGGPVTQFYEVVLPVPYPVDGPTHCSHGVDGVSQDRRAVGFSARGRLDVTLSKFAGDWVLELYDAKGRLLGQAAALEPTNPAPVRKVTYKKVVRGQRVTIAVCNVTGGPYGMVTVVFTAG